MVVTSESCLILPLLSEGNKHTLFMNSTTSVCDLADFNADLNGHNKLSGAGSQSVVSMCQHILVG